MSTVKRVSKNTFWLTIAELVGKGSGFFIAIILARYLGPEGYGYYTTAIAFAFLFQVIIDFGLKPLLVREVARNNKLAEKYLGNFLAIKLILTVIYMAGVGIVFWLLEPSFSGLIWVLLAAAHIVLVSFTDIFQGIFQAFEKMKFQTIVRSVTKAFVFGLTVLVVVLGLWTTSALLALVVGTAMGTILAAYLCRKHFVKIKLALDKKFLKTAIKHSALFAITNVFIAIYFKIDAVMIESMKGATEVGYYNTGYELVFAFMFIPSVLSGAIYPVISRFFKEDKNKISNLVGRLIKYYTITAVALTLFLLLLGGSLIRLFFGVEYEPAISIFHQLVFVLVFVFNNFLVGTLLNASNKQFVTTIAAGICAAVNVTLNLFLIPEYGAAGAAIATIITEAILGIISFLYLHFKLYPIFTAKNFAKFGLLAIGIIGSSATAYYLSSWNIYVATAAGLGVFALLILAVRLYTKKDKDYLREILRK